MLILFSSVESESYYVIFKIEKVPCKEAEALSRQSAWEQSDGAHVFGLILQWLTKIRRDPPYNRFRIVVQGPKSCQDHLWFYRRWWCRGKAEWGKFSVCAFYRLLTDFSWKLRFPGKFWPFLRSLSFSGEIFENMKGMNSVFSDKKWRFGCRFLATWSGVLRQPTTDPWLNIYPQ